MLFSFLSVFILSSRGQTLNTGKSGHGICKDGVFNSVESLSNLNNCVVVLGDLKLLLMEKTNTSSFKGIKFPDLREVTGYVVLYRISGLESVGHLFPNLARIRGTKLIDNFGLIVYDVPNLKEIGLYSLLKIDRGGVVIWGSPHTCYVHTVDWKTIAPRSRHVLMPPDRTTHCNLPCGCSAEINYCWNNRKCQRFLDGPDADPCNDQCLGCRNTNPDECTLCRYYTHRGRCVPKCPDSTLILRENQYCITKEECAELKRWEFNKTCVFDCPVDYVVFNKSNTVTCKPCLNCHKTCGNQKIQTLSHIQKAERCVYINGSLTIHLWAIPDAMEELTTYLGRIQEVTDYIEIYGSITITSLNFLTALRTIGGRKLINNSYSLIINNMPNLQTLFTHNVTKNLKVQRGKLKMHRNPMLCKSKIEEIVTLFPEEPNEIDIPTGMNGYSGGCAEASVDLKVVVVNETTAMVMFNPLSDPEMHYTVLYVRLPPNSHTAIVPETCSESEWYAVTAPNIGFVKLTSLHPASTYAVCIETYKHFSDNQTNKPLRSYLARSNIVNFTTPIGNVAPPFITELVASSSQVVVLRWVDHKYYRPHITRYELDLRLIEIHPKDLTARDHCNNVEMILEETDYTRHAVVLRPPPDYDRTCESMCGILATATAGAMVEEYFDIDTCSVLDSDCNTHEEPPPRNSTFGKYVRTMALNINGPRKDFQVGGMAPFRDYRFRLRACVGDKCSSSRRAVVRTLRSPQGDVPKVIFYSVNDSGQISVKWEPPDVTNGPILAYSVHVLPYIKGESEHILPQSWCVLPSELSLSVKSQIVSIYLIRVCSTTLGSFSACSEWQKLVVSKVDNNFLWAAISFGVLITIIPILIGYYCRSRNNNDDVVPLIDSPSMYRSSNLELFYNVPLRY